MRNDAPPHPSPHRQPCRIETFVLGPFETNCYLVYESSPAPGSPCWIVDAGFEPAALIHRIGELGLAPQALILTHAHVDHIAGVDEILREFPKLPVLIHSDEASWLDNPLSNLSAAMGAQITACGGRGPSGALFDGQSLTLGSSSWAVLHTPGHSPGGITLFNPADQVALVGDSLFAGSIGRTDFPGSDFDTLANSIRLRLYTLPADTRIYPGHGPPTIIGRERLSNPFVRGM
jgi:hydroxyacylglutathione hydrolase